MLGQEEDHFIKRLEQEYICSISKTPMTDPVIAADGQTYDRINITQWFRQNNTSPNTGLQLPNTDLIPNLALKNIIDKINTELYGFLSKEQSLKTYISQLKEEIDYLKVELKHQKERNDQQYEKEERQFKSRKIQKNRHQDKDNQLKVIRDQKNAFQKQLLQLRTKEQQQNREIRILKEQLSTLKERFNQTSRLKKIFQEQSKKLKQNRDLCKSKVRNSFSSNLVFICHLIQSIEDVKKIVDPQIEQQQKRQKGTQESINVQRSPEDLRNVRKQIRDEVIRQIELGIEERICGLRRQDQQQQLESENNSEIRRLIFRRRIMQRQGRGYLPPPQDSINDRSAFGRRFMPRPNPVRLREMLRNRNRNTQTANILPSQNQPSSNHQTIQEAQPQAQNQSQPQAQTQPNAQTQSQPQTQTLVQRQTESQHQNQNQPQLQNELQRIFQQPQFLEHYVSKRKELLSQLNSIKWLMTKRNYRTFPSFYDYQFIKQHNESDIYWFGVRIRVLQSRIPFVEYLPHFWSHVRILDLSACNIDDNLWLSFIENRQNFTQLAFINLDRNAITNVEEKQITDFDSLKIFIIKDNKLNKESVDMLTVLKGKRQDIRIQFDQFTEPNMQAEENQEFL